MKASATGEYTVKSLGVQDASRKAHFAGIIRDARVLGCDAPVTWTRDGEGLHLRADFQSKMPVVFRLTVD